MHDNKFTGPKTPFNIPINVPVIGEKQSLEQKKQIAINNINNLVAGMGVELYKQYILDNNDLLSKELNDQTLDELNIVARNALKLAKHYFESNNVCQFN